MNREQAFVGQLVKTNRAFSGVPFNTTGQIDEDYGTGVTVQWDLPHWGQPLRDGFDKKTELQYLDILPEDHDVVKLHQLRDDIVQQFKGIQLNNQVLDQVREAVHTALEQENFTSTYESNVVVILGEHQLQISFKRNGKFIV